jgi:hypothetical protein
MEVSGQLHALAILPQGNNPSTHLIGGCVLGYEPWAIQPITSYYANYTILARAM